MDKRKVIAAYRRGFINVRECAQILGVDVGQITGLINDPHLGADPQQNLQSKRSVIG
ncbi:hypothetical protein Back11_23340 [Paenibacillus baekrokdamisoli]|uniref:Uncharacterized protein n=1 Tax=Paenibacillus baekrokdamisoli TaxID=1712516 RepID=A0A3G9JDC9_9BACL|nr:hypothetical protein [Paenibacillus baekrokdamisoli]MBB3069657.1 hypothetical protein [Paenibacillus baekrokdamisoli]BBH20989.1 hypothetical protein Back11_23340 [Paenibacillus baekrokdamisoli]